MEQEVQGDHIVGGFGQAGTLGVGVKELHLGEVLLRH